MLFRGASTFSISRCVKVLPRAASSHKMTVVRHRRTARFRLTGQNRLR